VRHSRHGSAIRRRRLALQSPLLSETSDCGLPEMSLERAGSTSWTHRHIFEKRYSILVVTIVTFIFLSLYLFEGGRAFFQHVGSFLLRNPHGFFYVDHRAILT